MNACNFNYLIFDKILSKTYARERNYVQQMILGKLGEVEEQNYTHIYYLDEKLTPKT